MIRFLSAAIALLATPAFAQTEHQVTGANPAPHFAVCAGDTLILRQAIGRELNKDGSRKRTFTVWIDRANGRGFELDGATRLAFSGEVQGKGFVYVPIDAKPCAQPVAAPASDKAIAEDGVFHLASTDRLLLPSPLKDADADTASLRFSGVVGGRYAYEPTRALTVGASDAAKPKRKFRNGVALSNSVNGYVEDAVQNVAPYIFTAGVGSIRLPIKRSNLWNGTALTPVIKKGQWDTPQLEPIFRNIELALANDVMFVIDDHTYSKYGEPDVLKFWVAMGKALQERFGKSDLIVLELQNESGRGDWDPAHSKSVKDLVVGIRAAGITYPLAIGWGGWNDVGNFSRAMTALDTVGGPKAVDPLNKIIWTGHHYPTTTGNDQAKAGRNKPEINGSSVSPAVPAFFDGCKARALKCMVTEIGMGGGARGWLANGSGNPKFDGKAWFREYEAIQSRYAGTVVGTIVWGGGSAWNDAYAFKVEYQKDGWAQTQATDFYSTLKQFWGR